MVYRMGKTPEMGQYPDCNFVDGDCLNIHLEEPLTAEMRSAAAGNKGRLFDIGYPVEAKNVPTVWKWASAKPIPDYYTPEGFPCVSPRMKDIIERFEPGVHQFFPLKVLNKRHEQIAEHYLWVVCNRIDSVDREHTNLVFRNNVRWRSDGIENSKASF